MIRQKPINSSNGISGAITSHYHKEGWSNFIPNTVSLIKATAILVTYD